MLQKSAFLLCIMIAIQSISLHSMQTSVPRDQLMRTQEDNDYINKLKGERNCALRCALFYGLLGVGTGLTLDSEKATSDAQKCSASVLPRFALYSAGSLAFCAAVIQLNIMRGPSHRHFDRVW